MCARGHPTGLAACLRRGLSVDADDILRARRADEATAAAESRCERVEGRLEVARRYGARLVGRCGYDGAIGDGELALTRG